MQLKRNKWARPIFKKFKIHFFNKQLGIIAIISQFVLSFLSTDMLVFTFQHLTSYFTPLFGVDVMLESQAIYVSVIVCFKLKT